MKFKTEYLLPIWVVLTLPLTFLGYGSHGDAWRVARTAKVIWQTGHYHRSRSAGFPLFELAVTPLVHIGQWYLSNLLPLAFGAIAILAFVFLGRKKKLKSPLLATLSFAFLPIVMNNAATTLDYIPVLALLVWAYVVLLERKWLWAGVFIGLACGFRVTSGLFVIPSCLYVYLVERRVAPTLRLLGIAVAVGLLAYSPVLLTYGVIGPRGWGVGDNRLDLWTELPIGGYYALRLFGILQTVLLCCVFLVRALKGTKGPRDWPFNAFHFTNTAVWLGSFALLPTKPEFLLPLVPSVILLLDRTAGKKSFALVAAVLLSYHFVQLDAVGGRSGKRHVDVHVGPGFTVRDVQARRFILSLRKAATAYVAPQKMVLMLDDAGSWIATGNDEWTYDGLYRMYRQRHGDLFVSEAILDEPRLKQLGEAGFRLVVWNDSKWEYVRVCTFDWQHYVNVVDNLSGFFGVPIQGRSLTQFE